MAHISTADWPPVYDSSYRPPSDERYWDREREMMPVERRNQLILSRIQAIMQWAWARSEFYRRRWTAAGLEPGDIKTLEDFARVPIITKADLRADQLEHPPFGSYLCVPESSILRIHGTSGTTGRPTAFAISRDDWARIGEAFARVMWSFGIRERDTVFIAAIFSLYLGSWGALLGTERLGAKAFPFGAGVPSQTLQAVKWIQLARATAFYGTPSYALRLAESARREGVDPSSLGLRILFFSGEPGAGIPSMKQKTENTFQGACIDTGSMSEMTPWMHLAECYERRGMHLWQDIVYTEVVHPKTFLPVPFGGRGTPVYTHLERTSQPMIRLLSGDLVAEWTDEPCPCGRTYPRFPRGILGRIDDMFTVRGENVYASAIEEVVRGFPQTASEFEIVLERVNHMDELTVRVEVEAVTDASELRDAIATALQRVLGVRARVELLPAGTLPRTDGKSFRVRDMRVELFGMS